MTKTQMFECPKCGSFRVNTEDYELDVEDVFLEQSCLDCGASWRERGTMTLATYSYNGVAYSADTKENYDK